MATLDPPPLSPSRLGNSPAPLPPLATAAPTPARKRIVFEQDDDFFQDALLAEAEEDDEQPPEDMYDDPHSTAPVPAPSKVFERRVAPVASSSSSSSTRPLAPPPAPVAAINAGQVSQVKEGKKRLVLEVEEGFGFEDDEEDARPVPSESRCCL